MSESKFDPRYTTSLEFCGASSPKHVVRFCGDFVASCDTIDEALLVESNHIAKRGSDLVTKCTDLDCEVLLLRGNKKYRVVYGAEVKEFKDKLQAFEEYSHCLLHSAQCSGKLD